MARVKISEEEYKAIKAKWEAEKDKKAANRLHILMLRYEGVSNNICLSGCLQASWKHIPRMQRQLLIQT